MEGNFWQPFQLVTGRNGGCVCPSLLLQEIIFEDMVGGQLEMLQ